MSLFYFGDVGVFFFFGLALVAFRAGAVLYFNR